MWYVQKCTLYNLLQMCYCYIYINTTFLLSEMYNLSKIFLNSVNITQCAISEWQLIPEILI
jgi:hypothetical protein